MVWPLTTPIHRLFEGVSCPERFLRKCQSVASNNFYNCCQIQDPGKKRRRGGGEEGWVFGKESCFLLENTEVVCNVRYDFSSILKRLLKNLNADITIT